MTETTMASSFSASGMRSGLFTWAKSTLTPFCNMGVITMKMISSTSITSTMGVTLMFELTLAPSLRVEIAINYPVSSVRSYSQSSREVSGGRQAPDAGSATLSHQTPALLENLGPAGNTATLQEVIDQFARGVIHLHVERFHAAG